MRRVKRLIRTRHVWHRMTAVLICMVMVLGMVFQTTAYSADTEKGTEKAQKEEAVTKTADESTINDWQQYFENEKDTSNAGRIWTDKTVSDGTITVNETGQAVEKMDADNFQISLSAMGATESIKKIGVTPVDVMLVLDISASMWGDAVEKLIASMNLLIKEVLELNPNNKIGCVLFSGGTWESKIEHAVCILPLGHYTSATNIFLEMVPLYDGDWQGVRVNPGVKDSKGNFVNPDGTSQIVDGSTYIQNALLLGYEEIEKGYTLENEPYLVLASDGAPTAASTLYNKRSDADINLNSKTDSRAIFLSQLTLSWVKEKIRELYHHAPQIYTLGIEPLNYSDFQSVLNPKPEGVDKHVDYSWEKFLLSKVNEKVKYEYETVEMYLTKTDEIIKSKENRFYVDKYFEVSRYFDYEEIETRVYEILDQIQKRTVGKPEKQEIIERIKFEDSIGEYMDVKYIGGVMCDGVLNKGNTFAKNINVIGDATVVALNEKLATDSGAMLLQNATDQKQIYYNSDTDFSNHVDWYADANGKYLAPFKQGENAPEGAQFLKKSYFYYGNPDGLAEELLKLDVTVEDNLSTNEQIVKFSIPQSLLPVLQYEITTDNSTESTTAKINAVPIHLFYEVNLKDGINKYDLSDINSNYPFIEITDTAKVARFYTNYWIKQQTDNVARTFSKCTLSSKNNFYYFSEDTPIYIKSVDGQYELFTGEEIQQDTTYYYRVINRKIPSGMEVTYTQIDPDLLSKVESKEGRCVIPLGTSRPDVVQEVINKQSNITETAPYSKSSSFQNTDITTLLGNNGLYTITQGKLTVSKTVNEYADNDDENTEFQFELKLPSLESGITIKSVNMDECVKYPIENGTIKFALKNSKNVSFWLPVGDESTVKEIGDAIENYTVYMTVIQNGIESSQQEVNEVALDKISSAYESKVIVENELLTAPYYFYKNDENRKGLAGAVFHLYRLKCINPKEHVNHDQLITDSSSKECWEFLGEGTSSSRTGRINFEVKPTLKTGLYRLVEVKAPKDYVCPEGQWNIYIDAKHITPSENTITAIPGPNGEIPPAVEFIDYYTNVRFYFANYKAIDPPITGGGGTWLYSLFGSLGVLGGIGMVIYQIRRKKYGNS